LLFYSSYTSAIKIFETRIKYYFTKIKNAMNINQQLRKVQDRTLSVWFQKSQNREIKLLRFQAWGKKRITSLLETITYNFPLGCNRMV
jgi:hypothetical protein